MRSYFFIAFFSLAGFLFAQVPKSSELAVVAQVKKGRIVLRWAPANAEIWKAGNTYGYKIERVPFEQYMNGTSDSSRFKNAQVINSTLTPWDRNDARWNSLIEKNKSASFLYANLFTAATNITPQKKQMAFAMLMKSCDLQKELALAHGLTVADSSFNENEIYIYRVSLNVPQKTVRCAPALIVVNPKELSTYAKIETLKGKFGDRCVLLNFVTLGVKDYAGYWIERSEDSVKYQAVNTTPFIRTTTKYDRGKAESLFRDSLPVNNKKYYYRVKGITCFGEPGMPSKIISGIGREALKDYPLIDSTIILKNSEVAVRFHMPPKFDKNTLKGFMIFRSEKRAADYIPVSGMLAPKTEVFTDVKPNECNYYKIAAYNIYGDSIFSYITYAKLIDETPPAIPEEPTGTIDSNGVVRITWQANTEKDFLGYRVYRCNGEREQPVELTKKLLTQPAFKDSVTLKTLTREVFYSIRAVDKVHNNSAYSKYCRLVRPDKINPIAIVFSEITPTDSSIILNWQRSNSNDVKQYKLYRKSRNKDWQCLKEWNASEKISGYADTSTGSAQLYRYKMEVIDESGNRSVTESHEILFKPIFFGKMKGFKAITDLGNRTIELQWQAHGDAYNYTLYKSKNDAPLQAFKTFDASTQNFVDKELYPNNKYRYAIKATLRSGAESKMSEVLVVEF